MSTSLVDVVHRLDGVERVLKTIRDPIAWILVVAGVVELISGGTVARGAILFAGAALILLRRMPVIHRSRRKEGTVVLPSLGPSSLPSEPIRRMVERPGFIVATIGATLLVSLFPVHSWPLTALTGVVGIVSVWWAWATTTDEENAEPPRPAAFGPWLVLALAIGLWELSALLGQPSIELGSYSHPTISYLLDPVLATYPGRVLGFLCWLALGRGLVVRS